MMDIATLPMAIFLAASANNAEPVSMCEIRTQAWCMIQGTTHFDVTTVDNDTRVWLLRSKMLPLDTIRVVESRACSSYPADIQEKSEALMALGSGAGSKYVITWKLHRDGSCVLRFELPVVGRRPNEIAYYLVGSSFNACSWDKCPGISLALTAKVARSKQQ